MLTVYDEVKSLLQREPRARERKNKDRGIRLLLLARFPELENVPKDILVQAFREYSSYDRAWRKTTEENPELRGADYNEKFRLEENKKEELGYPSTQSFL